MSIAKLSAPVECQDLIGIKNSRKDRVIMSEAVIQQQSERKKWPRRQQRWLIAAFRALGHPYRLRLFQTFVDCSTPIYVALVKGAGQMGIWSGNTSPWFSKDEAEIADLTLPSLPVLLLSPRHRRYLSRLHRLGLINFQRRSRILFVVDANRAAVSSMSHFLRRCEIG